MLRKDLGCGAILDGKGRGIADEVFEPIRRHGNLWEITVLDTPRGRLPVDVERFGVSVVPVNVGTTADVEPVNAQKREILPGQDAALCFDGYMLTPVGSPSKRSVPDAAALR